MESQGEAEVLREDDIRQFVCFKLADEEYAIDIVEIQEVIRVPAITEVPQMPAFTLGIINVRGSVIPVFDLRKKLYLPEKALDGNTKIVIARVDEEAFGMIVDEVLDNVKLEANQIDPAPTVKMKVNRECINGLGKLDNRMIALLNLTRIHEDIKKDILGEG